MALTGRNAVLAIALGAVALVVFIVLVTSARGAGCTKTWNGGAGTWETPSDWTPVGVPANGDSVCITASGTYTVTLSSGASITSLTVGGPSSGGGVQTLDMQPGASLTASAGGTI